MDYLVMKKKERVQHHIPQHNIATSQSRWSRKRKQKHVMYIELKKAVLQDATTKLNKRLYKLETVCGVPHAK